VIFFFSFNDKNQELILRVGRFIKSSHPNVKRAGGIGAIAKTLQVLVDDESSSTSDQDLSDLTSAHRSYLAAFQSFIEISRRREEARVRVTYILLSLKNVYSFFSMCMFT